MLRGGGLRGVRRRAGGGPRAARSAARRGMPRRRAPQGVVLLLQVRARVLQRELRGGVWNAAERGCREDEVWRNGGVRKGSEAATVGRWRRRDQAVSDDAGDRRREELRLRRGSGV